MNWNKLEQEVKALSRDLSILTRERDIASRQYNSLLQDKSNLKNKYNSILKETKEKRRYLINLHHELSKVRKEWILAGGTINDFCLDVVGYKLQLEFEKNKNEILNFIKEQPPKYQKLYNDKEKVCDKVFNMIKSYDFEIKKLNRKLSALHIQEQVNDYIHLDSNLKNSGEVFVEIQVNQISVRQKKIYLGHKRYYVRVDSIWYRTYGMNSNKKIPLTEEENDKLFNLINKYLKNSVNVTKN
jgi:hypothetical protein